MEGVDEKQQKVNALDGGGSVEMVDAEKRCGRPGDEDAELVEECVERVELPVGGEGRVVVVRWSEGEEENGCDCLVDSIFRYVDEEEGEHVRHEQRACAGYVVAQCWHWWGGGGAGSSEGIVAIIRLGGNSGARC